MMNPPPDIRQPPRTMALAGIALCGIVAGVFIGGTTNAVNGLVGPQYFIWAMHWSPDSNVWGRSVAQGILEGVFFGFVASFVFTIGVAWITGGNCSFGFAFRHLLVVVGGVYLFWFLGGWMGVGLAALNPAPFLNLRGMSAPHPDLAELVTFAWVGGSINGAQLGGLFWAIVGLVMLRAKWRYHLRVERTLGEAIRELDEDAR